MMKSKAGWPAIAVAVVALLGLLSFMWKTWLAEPVAEFARRPFEQLMCPRSLDSSVALVNAPSATVTTFHLLKHGLLSGFVVLVLEERSTQVQFHLDGGKCAEKQ